MSSNYPTIQQHEPLTPPRSWGTEERRLLVRLEEILDDIYRRFGRIKITDLGKALRDEVGEIHLKVSKDDYTASDTAPAEPNENCLWLDTSIDPAVLKKWNGSAWENTAAQEVHASGIDIMEDNVVITTRNFSIQIINGTTQEQELSVDKDGVFADTLSGRDIEGLPAARRYTGTSFTTNDMSVISNALNNKQLTDNVTVKITDTSIASSLILKGITGSGKLTIEGAGDQTPTELFGGITVEACLARIEFKYIPASYSVIDSPFVKFTDCSGGSSGTQTVTVTDQVIKAHTTASWYTPANGWAPSRNTMQYGWRSNGRTYAGLAWFDLSGIPAGAVFTAAKLRFYRTGTSLTGSRTLVGNTAPCTGPDQSFRFSDLTQTGNRGSGTLNAWTEIDETGDTDADTTAFCELLRTGAYVLYNSNTGTAYQAELSGSAGEYPPELVVSYEYTTSGSALDVTYTDNGLADYLRGIGAIT